jgi:hypothetical protein
MRWESLGLGRAPVQISYPHRPRNQADGDYRYMAEHPHARSHFPLVPSPTADHAARRRRLPSPPAAPSRPQPPCQPGPPRAAGLRPSPRDRRP